MKRQLVLTACIALLAFVSACQPQSATSTQTTADTRDGDESTLREWDAQWSKAASGKDVDKTVSYYADDALVLPPNAPAMTSKDAIRKAWEEMLTAPSFSGGWKATKVEVAKSGEVGYVSGTWEFKWNDAKGKPVTDRGNFVEVVKKQANGQWKCVTDIWNSELPLPSEKK